MKILGFRISMWIKHPRKAYRAYQMQEYPVVNLDNIELNCWFCGHDHSRSNKKRVWCLCCKKGK